MSGLRGVGAVGLVLVSVGTVWHSVDSSARRPSSSPSRSTSSAAQASPVPVAEAAVASTWSTKTAGSTSVAVGACVRRAAVIRDTTPSHVTVEVLCQATVRIDDSSTNAALVWTVALSWSDAHWVVRAVSP